MAGSIHLTNITRYQRYLAELILQIARHSSIGPIPLCLAVWSIDFAKYQIGTCAVSEFECMVSARLTTAVI